MTSSTVEGPALSAGPTRQPRTKRQRNIRKWVEITVFAGPAIIVFLTFVVYPIIQAGYYSLFNWNGLGSPTRFIGIQNYKWAFEDTVFIKAIGHNFIILIASLLIQGPLAILVALLLNRKMKGRGFIRAAIFVPYVLAEAIAAIAWRLMLNPNSGAVNDWLAAAKLPFPKDGALGTPSIALVVMILILTWKYLGFAVLIMLAGLQGVPEELPEAASIDGANWWRIQWHITLPLLGPTIRIWVFLSMIGSLQLFDMVRVTTNGGPLNSTETMATYLLRVGKTAPGQGSAFAVILFVISLAIALTYQRIAMRRDLEGAVTRGVR